MARRLSQNSKLHMVTTYICKFEFCYKQCAVRTLRGPVAPLLPSSDCESRPIVSLLERLRAPSASELGRKRKIDANPAHPKGKKRSTRRTVRICSVFSLFSDFFCEEFLENNRALTGE